MTKISASCAKEKRFTFFFFFFFSKLYNIREDKKEDENLSFIRSEEVWTRVYLDLVPEKTGVTGRRGSIRLLRDDNRTKEQSIMI